MQTHRKTNLEPSLHMRAENETKRRVNQRPSRNQIQPQPQEKDQARTGKASDLTAASMNHEGQSKMRARQNGDNKHHTTRCKNKYFIAPQTRLQ
jgi:hypothetical protein